MNLVYCKNCNSVFTETDCLQFYNHYTKDHECPHCHASAEDRDDLIAHYFWKEDKNGKRKRTI